MSVLILTSLLHTKFYINNIFLSLIKLHPSWDMHKSMIPEIQDYHGYSSAKLCVENLTFMFFLVSLLALLDISKINLGCFKKDFTTTNLKMKTNCKMKIRYKNVNILFHNSV